MTAPLERFLAEAEARRKEVGLAHNHYSGPCAACHYERDLPAALALLRAFAAVVEEARYARFMIQNRTDDKPYRGVCEQLGVALAAADAALAAHLGKEDSNAP